MIIKPITPAEGFSYSDAPQRSPEWIAIRAPRIGASEIGGYMAKGVKGQYLASRKEAEKKQKTFKKETPVVEAEPFVETVNVDDKSHNPADDVI